MIQPTTRTRSFAVSKGIIVHLIKSQAGSLGKALMESVMNGIDAGATRIDITLDRKGYTVQDNGHGFQTVADIERYFEEFGFDHTTDEEAGRRQFGQFGLGRGQQWNWASTLWRTRTFEMHVDIRASGLDYTLHEGLPDEPGTTITGTFYEAISTQEVLTHVKHLGELVKFSPVPVVVNGHDVTTHPDTVRTWTHTTDEAWVHAKEHGPLRVYNMGMFVVEIPPHRAGCSGTVVTKPGSALTLNMARNDILDNEDGLWRRLKKHLKDIGDERTRTSARVSESDLRRFTAQVAVLDADFAQYQKLRLFTDAAGKGLTITKLITSLRETGVLTLHSAEHATLSRRAVENRMATVLDPKTLERWHVETLGELVDLLERYSSHAGRFGQYDGTRHAEVLAQVRVEPNLPLAVPELRGFFTLNETVKGYPKLILDGLREVSRDVQFAVWTYRGGRYGRSGPFREYSVKAGQSDVADVWTDGQQYLAVHEDRLSGAGTARDVELIILDTLTTLLPGRNSMTEAPDDSTAEDLMHFLRAAPRLTEWTMQVIRHVAKEGLRQGVKVPHRLLQVLGQAERLDDQAQREPALN